MTHLERLSATDFSFHEFDSQMNSIERLLCQIGIRRDEPTVEVVEYGVLIPAVGRQPGELTYRGGLLDRDGASVEVVHLRRKGKTRMTRLDESAASEANHVVDEEVVYLGWLFNHFGHFLLESLARMWFLREVNPSTPVVFHAVSECPPQGIFKRILSAFNLVPDRILILDKPTRLRRLLIPEPLYEIGYFVHEWMPSPFQESVLRTIGEVTDFSEQPVYLSRRLLPTGRRKLVGERELEEVLRKHGILIAYPETMTFEDQLQLFNRHTDIITSTGSAAHGVLFALNQPRLHMLTDVSPLADYFLVPKVTGAMPSYINCLSDGNDRSKGRGSPQQINLEAVIDYLDGVGLLNRSDLSRNRPRADYGPSFLSTLDQATER